MRKYKKTIIIRTILLGVLVVIGISIGLFDIFWGQKHLDPFLFCFQCGFSFAMSLVASIWVGRYCVILSNDTKLQLQYNKENDERMKAIKAKAGLPVVLILSIILILVGMVIGYFNATVFYTLIVVASAQLIVSCIIKFVYIKIL